MPTVPTPLFSPVYKNIDESIVSDDGWVQYNGSIGAKGGLKIRPGEVLAVNSAKRNDGLYHWPDKNYIISVDELGVTFYTVLNESLVSAFSGATVTFIDGVPVIFCASNSDKVFMAGNAKINYVNTLGVVTELADADAPTQVSHVAFLDGYILANNNNGKIYWSNIPTDTAWSALDFASAEGSPDLVQGIYVVQRQIYILGTVSTEIWFNDGETPFSRIPGGLIEMGCIAKYSPIKYENSLIWLNHEREFVKFTGTAVEKLSGPYNEAIQDFSTVSDCIGNLVKKDGKTYCLFQFAIEGRTLAYDPELEDWSEWASWNSDSMAWEAYDIRSTARDINTGKTFVGKSSARIITCLNSDSREDLIEAAVSRPFKFLRQTGFIDHGTGKKKRLEVLRFRAKRGAPGSGSPKLMLRYRNDGSSQWSSIKEIDLGAIGDNKHHIELKRLGMYRSRQYEISATDDIKIALSAAESEITVIR